MDKLAVTAQQGAMLEQVLIGGDLSRLKPEDRVMYYKQVCESVGLNPITKPFEYITLNGKLTLYALRSCTEQLRKINGVSIIIVSREVVEDCYVVTARATDAKGRHDESIGAVPISGLKGEARSNSMMKAETKAKRRVTLSICGLGMLDESEADSISGAHYPSPGSVTAGAMQALPIKVQEVVMATAAEVRALLANNQDADAYALWQNSNFDTDEKVAFWSQLDAKQRGVLDRMWQAEEAQNKGVISPAKHKRLEAMIKEFKLDREGLKNWCTVQFGKAHFTELNNDEYRALDTHIASMTTAAASPSSSPATASIPTGSEPASAAATTITEADESVILDLLEAHGVTLAAFLKRAGVKRILDLQAERLTGATDWIKQQRGAK